MSSSSTTQPKPKPSNRDLLAVRAYVTAQDATNYDSLAPETVVLDLTHSNLHQRHVEIRFGKSETIQDLRAKIHQQTGTPPQHQHLQVQTDGRIRFEIPPEDGRPTNTTTQQQSYDHYKIGYFVADRHGTTVHCIDTNPHSLSARGGLEDVRLVPKYVLTESEYAAKTQHTLRAWKREQQQRDPDFTLQRHARQHAALQAAVRRHKMGLSLPPGFQVVVDENGREVVRAATETSTSQQQEPPQPFGPDSVQHCAVGDRCQIIVGQRRGRVAWKGEIAALGSGGYWVGIRLDEPTGRHDGTVADDKEGEPPVRYFEAPPRCGAFVRGPHVECGDFPERDILDEMSSDEDDDEL